MKTDELTKRNTGFNTQEWQTSETQVYAEKRVGKRQRQKVGGHNSKKKNRSVTKPLRKPWQFVHFCRILYTLFHGITSWWGCWPASHLINSLFCISQQKTAVKYLLDGVLSSTIMSLLAPLWPTETREHCSGSRQPLHFNNPRSEQINVKSSFGNELALPLILLWIYFVFF